MRLVETRTKSINNEFNTESCETILSVVKDLYQDDIDRYKQIENKTMISLAFLGIILTIQSSSFSGGNFSYFENIKLNTILFCFDVFIIVALFISTWFMLASIKLSNFSVIRVADIVNVEDASSDPAQVKINIAATYQNVIEHNRLTINSKTEKYGLGLLFLKIGFVLFFISLMIKGVVSYVW